MDRGAGARLGRARKYVWGILTIFVSLVSVGLADTTPEDALGAVDPALDGVRAELASRERALAGPYGVDADVTFRQSVDVGTRYAPWAPPQWTTAINVDATLGYSYDEPALLADLAALERAHAAVARLGRSGPSRALRTHARMLQVQLTVEELEEQVASQAGELAVLDAPDAEGALALTGGAAASPQLYSPDVPDPGGRSPDGRNPKAHGPKGPSAVGSKQARRSHDLRALGLEGLELRLEQARLELAALEDELSRYGLSGPATYVPLRFALPPTDVHRTSAYHLKLLAVRQAEADLRQAHFYGTFQGLAVTGSVSSGNVGMSTHLGIVESHPRAEVSLAFPGGPDAWSIGVEATVVLSTETASLSELERRVAAARTALETYELEFPLEGVRRRAAAELAERALSLAERQAALAGTWDARRTLAAAWAEYVRQVRGYLEFVDGLWEPAGSGTAPDPLRGGS